MKIDLTGHTAVITGGSRGLGESMAKALAASGASIALVARDIARLDGVKAAIVGAGGKAESFTADVTNEQDVIAMADAVTKKMGAVDIVINNAGTNIRKKLTDFTLDEFRSVIDSSLISTFLVTRAFLGQMRGRGYGRVINMTSMLSHVSLPERTAYSSAKSALLGFTRALALEVASDGITVNGISPGPCGTELNAVVMNNPDANRTFLANLPVGRWGKVEEIASLACYLCSEAAGFITGTDIVIDGGWTAK
jgi:NAD(P)-dependent dehydrogenase (short-subunit alcohol dehydrogenase family)